MGSPVLQSGSLPIRSWLPDGESLEPLTQDISALCLPPGSLHSPALPFLLNRPSRRYRLSLEPAAGRTVQPSSDSSVHKGVKLLWPFQNLKHSLNMPEHVLSRAAQ